MKIILINILSGDNNDTGTLANALMLCCGTGPGTETFCPNGTEDGIVNVFRFRFRIWICTVSNISQKSQKIKIKMTTFWETNAASN
jgi:hypothetical protein